VPLNLTIALSVELLNLVIAPTSAAVGVLHKPFLLSHCVVVEVSVPNAALTNVPLTT